MTKNTKLKQTLPLQFHLAPISHRQSNLRFPARKPLFTTFTLILNAAASSTGFLNTGLKRLLKSSQSLLVLLVSRHPHASGHGGPGALPGSL